MPDFHPGLLGGSLHLTIRYSRQHSLLHRFRDDRTSFKLLILALVRRKPGALLPLEVDICVTARRLRREFHGFELAKSLADGHERKRLTAYGTLYRALGRLEAMGLLTSRWEEPQAAADEG